jgi:hypothetical protein
MFTLNGSPISPDTAFSAGGIQYPANWLRLASPEERAAIGITEDHELHHFTRRLWAWRDEAGSAVTWAGEIGRAAMERGGARLWADLTARDVEGTTA